MSLETPLARMRRLVDQRAEFLAEIERGTSFVPDHHSDAMRLVAPGDETYQENLDLYLGRLRQELTFAERTLERTLSEAEADAGIYVGHTYAGIAGATTTGRVVTSLEIGPSGITVLWEDDSGSPGSSPIGDFVAFTKTLRS
mgnify:CR=1 FL=1